MKHDVLSKVRRILVYKRTHNGDPNELGQFGCHDCMKSVRDRDFDAVIGVGGITGARYGIQRKVNWIGLLPIVKDEADPMQSIPIQPSHSGARIVTFEHFLAFKECGNPLPGTSERRMFANAPEGPEIVAVAPAISRRLFERKARVLMLDRGCPGNSSKRREFEQAMQILALAKDAPPSNAGNAVRHPEKSRCSATKAKCRNTGKFPITGRQAYR